MTTPSELRAIAAEYNSIIHTWSGTPRAKEAEKQALLFETLASLLERVTALGNLTESLQVNAAIATEQALSAAQRTPPVFYTNPGANAAAVIDPSQVITFKTSDNPINTWEGRSHS